MVSVYLVVPDRTWPSLCRHLRAQAVREMVTVVQRGLLDHHRHRLGVAPLSLLLLLLHGDAVR